MAGRGRGKPTMSFTTEQLGFAKGELLPAPVLQPPSSYPLLEHRPLPFTLTNEMSYLVELKREFAEYMRESPNYVMPLVRKKDVERYSDRYQDAVTDKTESQSKHDWSRMPEELRPSRKRKAKKSLDGTASKKQKLTNESDQNINAKLAELEKSSAQQQSDAEEEGKEEEEKNSDQEMEENEEDEEEQIDEEMDDGTDYVNNYFDNGEGYDDDDDNLDDGPVF